jgi:dienelactone hydrolase
MTFACRSHLATLTVLLFVSTIGRPAFAADTITPSDKLPKTTPWNLVALSEPPEFEWVDAEGPVRSLLYAGEPYRGKPTQVFAYYATPGTLQGNAALDQKLPAMVLIHGGGGTAFREWAELWAKRGYAAIAMDLAGHRPIEGKNAHAIENRTRLDNGGPNQTDEEKFGSIDLEPNEQWPYHAVASAIRAHSLMRSFPKVDADRTAVTGISWGGYLTCIVSGLDNRFKVAVPVYGCGYLHDNSAWLDRFAKMTPEQKERWVTLWDPSQYLPSVSMPILFVNGTNDFAYPLDSYQKSFDIVPHDDKQLRVTVNLPHGHPPGWAPVEIARFVDQHLLQKDSLPIVGNPDVIDGKITMSVTASLPLKAAELHFTTDTKPINMREWKSVPAKIDDNQVLTDAPPDDATVWFLTVTDEKDGVISSRMMIRK